MGNIHFTKHAKKDNPVAKKGESYYYWSFPYVDKKYYSKEYPTTEQLIESGMDHEKCLQGKD